MIDHRQIIDSDSGGDAVIRGTSVSVRHVLERFSHGRTEEEVLNEFPSLSRDQIRACLAFAAEREGQRSSSSNVDVLHSHRNLDSEIEATKRLRTLHEIGAQLSIDQDLSEIFRRIVRLTCEQLQAEEAALFVLKQEKENVLTKVASVGPTLDSTARFGSIGEEYHRGEGLIGRVFRTQEYLHINVVPSDAEHYNEYANILPSRRVCHYLGVPLLMGDDVLGVIRVINKKAQNYSANDHNYTLAEGGFDLEDLELMQTIATQVAAAIRNAEFIEVQRYYQKIVASSPDPIIVLDRRGKVIVFNGACERIWNYSANEVLGRRVDQFYESMEHAKEIGRILQASENNMVEGLNARIKSRTGEIIPISLSASILRDKAGSVIGSIGAFKDLRETLQIQQQQLTAGKLATLDRLAHTVGHNVKHEIATALNYVDVLAFECDDPDKLAIYNVIRESLTEAVVKFRNMLMIGRPSPPFTQVLYIDQVIEKVANSIYLMAHSRRVVLTINYDAEGRLVDANDDQLRQVLFNLFDNSIDAINIKRRNGTIVSGQIRLSTAVEEGSVKIVWSDDGCGISADRLGDVFLPFVSDKPTGNGLGLFIVKNIVENHNGTITIRSEQGVYTSVEILLPLQG